MPAEKKRAGLSPTKLIVSIAISLVIWNLIFGSIAFAAVLIFSILVHEYGHYYWMGREGIKSRDMFMIPPFGAMALSRETWPGCGAEARIALAGPAFGLIPSIIFGAAYLASGNKMFAASAVLSSYINLLNLAPIAILDGGRIVKSILVSWNRHLEMVFAIVTAASLLIVAWYVSPLPALLVGYFWYRELRARTNACKYLRELTEELVAGEESGPGLSRGEIVEIFRKRYELIKETRDKLMKIANPPVMNGKEMAVAVICLFVITASHFTLLTLGSSVTGPFWPPDFLKLLKYF